MFPSGVADQFPDDPGLIRKGVEAYAGHPLFGTDGTAVGLLVVMHRQAFRSPAWLGSIIRIFAMRAAAELERIRDAGHGQRLEDRLRQSQKLETIGQLAGGMAHDFNNLLTPILGYAEILLEDTQASDPRHRPMAFIKKAAEKATSLTRQLLSFSRRQVLDLRPLDLNRVVLGFQRILRRTIREDVDISVDTRASRGTIVGDESQIEQILMNLAINAQDALPTGGSIRLITSEVDLPEAVGSGGDTVAACSHVVLSVADTGSGMDEDTRGRVFDPFFTTKEKGRGTGLGLATVYGIVKQPHGTIDVESRPGRGSTFRVYFPLDLSASAARSPVVGVTPTGREAIAVVEDDPSVRELTCLVLRRLGYTVIEFAGPAACLDRAATGDCRADLLLTDVVMPGMNGRQLYERLSGPYPR